VSTKGQATRATAFSDLEDEWKSFKSAEAILSDLEVYAPYFIALQEYKSIPKIHHKVNEVVCDLAKMPKLTVTWPFIMQVLHACATGDLPWQKAEASLRVVESMLVRRALVGWEPTGLHSVFKGLWQAVGGEPKQVREKIQTTTIKTPSDEDLRRELKHGAVDTRKMTLCVLWQYERFQREQERSDPMPELDATVEHIMPQAREPHWETVISSKEHKQVVGRLGNLVLVSGRLNKSLQNKGWGDKRKRYRTSDWLTTRKLEALRQWNTKTIDRRTEELTEWVLRRWPAL
jgi:hypothetical protein